MTLRELKQYRSICAEIEEICTETKNNSVKDKVRGSDDTFPYLTHSISISGVIPNEKNYSTLDDLRQLKARKYAIKTFVENIDDSLTRRIFKMRFIKGYSWGKVAMLTNNTVASVKMICYRYIKAAKK